jgi:hypothetical protein
LAATTLLILVLGIAVWLRTRSAGFVVGFAFLYYWTLYGAWQIVDERLNGDTDQTFTYLYYKMFPVYLDHHYMWALVLYALFIVTVQATVLVCARPRSHDGTLPALTLSHGSVVLFCLACVGLGYLTIKDSLDLTASLNMSGYAVVTQIAPLWNVYAILNNIALIVGGIGISVWFSGSQSVFLIGQRTWSSLGGYAILFAALLYLNMRLGNRSPIFFACMAAGLFYLANTRRVNWKLVILGGTLAIVGILIPGIMRDEYKLQEIQRQGWTYGLWEAIVDAGTSVETVSAHLSMYGSLHYDVPFTYGSSLITLTSSFVPRIFWPERPEEIYLHYVRHVRAMQGQGYTIHHATGWYLNFGIFGLVGGGAILGALWSWLFNLMHRSPRMASQSLRVLATVGFCSFTGFIPTLLRDGPEGYKGALVESVILPVIVLGFATVRPVLRYGRFTIAPLQLAGLQPVPEGR